jgi:hypothetical protein
MAAVWVALGCARSVVRSKRERTRLNAKMAHHEDDNFYLMFDVSLDPLLLVALSYCSLV